MTTERQFTLGMMTHWISVVPYIVAFAGNTWATYESPETEGNQFGLWNLCKRAKSNDTPDMLEEECKPLNMEELSALFHLTRAVFCLAMVCYMGEFLSKCYKRQVSETRFIWENVCVQAAVFILILSGVTLFPFVKEDFDKRNGVSSSFGTLVFLMFAIGGIHIITIFLTSMPLLERSTRNCRNRVRCSCCRKSRSTEPVRQTTRTASTATSISTSTTAAAATTTVTVTSRSTVRTLTTSTSCTDLSMVEIPKPPPYSERDCNYTYLYVSRGRARNTSPRPNFESDRSDSSDGDQDSSPRPSSGGIFTVLVNPALPPPTFEPIENANLQTPSQSEPSVPPPRYEDITADSGLQPSGSPRHPTAPPPSYESATSGDGVSSGTLQLDGRLLIESRLSSPPPPFQSDV